MSAERAAAARAVLVAAGRSERIGGSRRKPWIMLAGRPVFEHALAALDLCPAIVSVVVVAHAEDVETLREEMGGNPPFSRRPFHKVSAIVAGGAERCDSVRIGAEHPCEDSSTLLCIHDAARPLVSPEAIGRVVDAAARDGAALLALPVRDTLKRSQDGRQAMETVDRQGLWTAQTPQVFESKRFHRCLEAAAAAGLRPTDDSALWERFVGPVTLVRGEASNLKITLPDDLEIARALFAQRAESGA